MEQQWEAHRGPDRIFGLVHVVINFSNNHGQERLLLKLGVCETSTVYAPAYVIPWLCPEGLYAARGCMRFTQGVGCGVVSHWWKTICAAVARGL